MSPPCAQCWSAGSYPNDIWTNEIIQDAVVDSLQGAGPGSLLLQLVCLPSGLGQDGSLSDEHNMLSTELLLQLTDQPCLNLLESFQLRNWHEDHDCFLACGALNLLGGGDVQLAQRGLGVSVDLKVEESLGNLLLNLVWFLIAHFA